MEFNIRTVGKEKQLVLCGNFNAHSLVWGSRYTSCKGDRLVNWMEKINLILINDGDSPTCIRPQGTSIVDLTWATPIVARKITAWKVEIGMLSLSDHNYITFRIGTGRLEEGRSEQNKSKGINSKGDSNRSIRWKMETLDQETFDQVLE